MDAQEYIRSIATYYPDTDSIRRVLEFADVDIINIDLEGKPLNTWFDALKEVVRQDKMPAFLQTISKEYPALTIDERERHELKRFLSKKEFPPIGEKKNFLQRHGYDILKAAIVLLAIGSYFIVNYFNNKTSPVESPSVLQADTIDKTSSPFTLLIYKKDSIMFPSSKSIFGLKQYLLFEKENMRNKNPATSKLMYLNKELSNGALLSDISWFENPQVNLIISLDTVEAIRYIDLFIDDVRLEDPLIFLKEHMGYMVSTTSEGTKIHIPKIVGSHQLEIYFSDSLAVLPVTMEYSTAGINRTADDFWVNAKKLE